MRRVPRSSGAESSADVDGFVLGFDIVVEATGSAKILEDAINYVRRGGKLVVYGVYSSSARVSWPPSKICTW